MALHPTALPSPYEVLQPEQCCFRTAEESRDTAYAKLLPPLVAKIHGEVKAWCDEGYAKASAKLQYYFARYEALETVIGLYNGKVAHGKFDLLRFDAWRAGSHDMFDEDRPRYVIKMDAPQKMPHLSQRCEDASADNAHGRLVRRFVYVDQAGFERHQPGSRAALALSFTEYQA